MSRSSPPGRLAADGTFRANPGYELVLLDRLDPAERQLVGDLDDRDDLYGVLRPRHGSGLDPRSVSVDTALLFLTLAEPGRLPAYVRARLGAEAEPTMARLVLDGVLEVEHGGAYLSGAAAGDLVARRATQHPQGRVAELSAGALRYGQQLAGLDEALLATRLYCYGRQPVSAHLRRRLPDEAAVARYLGLGPGGKATAVLDAAWTEHPGPQVPATHTGRAYWRSWQARTATTAQQPAATLYKLYVSPSVEAMPAALETVASGLATTPGVRALKVGVDLDGICRPDKLVAYVERLDDLQEAATRLARDLDGCPAHGVPFTAAITSDGLLSWGADPPATGVSPQASWRMWVTERLAEYLLAARGSATGLEPWEFALERLRLGGVDTGTWIPASGMWPRVLART